MAEAAAARREARRKRILENSQNRLQIIAGKSDDDCPRKSPIRYSVPDQNRETSTPEISFLPSLENGLLVSESQLHGLLYPPRDVVAAGDGEVANDLASLLSPPEGPTQALWEKLVANRYDVVLLSLLLQLFHSLSLFALDNAYFFVPLIVYDTTKLIWFPTDSKSNIANAVLLLNGISTTKVGQIMKISEWAGVISQDICVFLFTTICIQSLLTTLMNNLIT